jgi:hypothetical protein
MREIVQWYIDNRSGDLYLTECNFGAGNAVDVDAWADRELHPFLDWCATQGRVRMALYFAWKWRGAPPLPTPVDAAGTRVEEVLETWVAPINGASEPTIEAVRDQLWAAAEQAEALGWPWLGQGVKALVALSKGDQ